VPHSVPAVTGHDWAAHSAEVRFVFGANDGDPYGKDDENCPFTDMERHLSEMTMDWWGSFARDGTPRASASARDGTDPAPTWPTQDTEGQVMEIRLPGGAVSVPAFRSSQCAFWQQFNPHGTS
jgi:carboxylesterase type B